MDGYDSATYGDRIADIYDSSVELPADTGEAAAFLAELAGSGPVLELTRSNVAWPIWTLTAATSVRHSAGSGWVRSWWTIQAGEARVSPTASKRSSRVA